MKTKRKLPSTPVGRKRLLKLADLLEADAKNKKGIKFNLTMWGQVCDNAKPVSCGTYGCAMGLAVASRAFVRAGLHPPSVDGSLSPRFGREHAFNAAARLFQIPPSEAHFLFSATRYDEYLGAKAERIVSKRIRNFVAGVYAR